VATTFVFAVATVEGWQRGRRRRERGADSCGSGRIIDGDGNDEKPIVSACERRKWRRERRQRRRNNCSSAGDYSTVAVDASPAWKFVA
jgi:hypothetical protein